jgi:subtilisin family serine protease
MRLFFRWLLVFVLLASPLHAEQRFIVRATTQSVLNTACLLLGCHISESLQDPDSQLFLVTVNDGVIQNLFVAALSAVLGILGVEPDSVAEVLQAPPPVPPALYDSQLVPYYGVDVRHGYLTQPAAQIIGLQDAQTSLGVAGAGTVAVIDTGVDPNHVVLQNVLLSGYDFTRNQNRGSEMADISQSTAAVVDGVSPAYVNANTAAIIDQSTAAVVDGSGYAGFGHGTMVAGVIHLVAPQAMILPLKAFQADGTGYTSDILRAIYWAVRNNARVINMSFSMPNLSNELRRAIDYATGAGVICVASAGNDGEQVSVYPAAFSDVLGVASTTDTDSRSTFSNYGQNLVWVAAPGEGIVTTYPYGTYAASWGTSFSAPFVSGTVALMLSERWDLTYSTAAAAVAQATPLGADLGNGRLDVLRAVQAAQTVQ